MNGRWQHIGRMYVDIDEDIRFLLAELSPPFSVGEVESVDDYVRHNECGIAMEIFMHILKKHAVVPTRECAARIRRVAKALDIPGTDWSELPT